jgi:hypothetical protein
MDVDHVSSTANMDEENKQTQWFQTAKRIIPTERPPLVGEVSANFSE